MSPTPAVEYQEEIVRLHQSAGARERQGAELADVTCALKRAQAALDSGSRHANVAYWLGAARRALAKAPPERVLEDVPVARATQAPLPCRRRKKERRRARAGTMRSFGRALQLVLNR